MALTADCIVQDLQIVRDYIGEDIDDDRKLEPTVNMVSRAITRYTQRQFWPEPAFVNKQDTAPSVAKIFRYNGDGYLSFAPYELRSLDPGGIKVYTDLPQTSWQTLQDQTPTVEAEYRLEPRNLTPENTYLWVALREMGEFGIVPVGMTGNVLNRITRGHQVTITGRWGMVAPPEEAVGALLITVDALWKDPEGFATRSIAGMSISALPFTALPAEAQSMLRALKRKRMAA